MGTVPTGITTRRIASAVTIASRYVPFATCLTQALTVRLLLNASEIENEVHIGVALKEVSDRRTRGFDAHAWVECEGNVVIGGSEQSAKYSRILTLRSSRTNPQKHASVAWAQDEK